MDKRDKRIKTMCQRFFPEEEIRIYQSSEGLYDKTIEVGGNRLLDFSPLMKIEKIYDREMHVDKQKKEYKFKIEKIEYFIQLKGFWKYDDVGFKEYWKEHVKKEKKMYRRRVKKLKDEKILYDSMLRN